MSFPFSRKQSKQPKRAHRGPEHAPVHQVDPEHTPATSDDLHDMTVWGATTWQMLRLHTQDNWTKERGFRVPADMKGWDVGRVDLDGNEYYLSWNIGGPRRPSYQARELQGRQLYEFARDKDGLVVRSTIYMPGDSGRGDGWAFSRQFRPETGAEVTVSSFQYRQLQPESNADADVLARYEDLRWIGGAVYGRVPETERAPTTEYLSHAAAGNFTGLMKGFLGVDAFPEAIAPGSHPLDEGEIRKIGSTGLEHAA